MPHPSSIHLLNESRKLQELKFFKFSFSSCSPFFLHTNKHKANAKDCRTMVHCSTSRSNGCHPKLVYYIVLSRTTRLIGFLPSKSYQCPAAYILPTTFEVYFHLMKFNLQIIIQLPICVYVPHRCTYTLVCFLSKRETREHTHRQPPHFHWLI